MGFDETELFDICGNFFVNLHISAAKLKGKNRWADKNPENLIHLEDWYQLLEGKMKFIFITRNPLDIMASLNEVGFPKALPPEFKSRVIIMRDFLQKGIGFIERFPDLCYSVKYEELTTNTDVELQKVYSFIGEKYYANATKDFLSRERGLGIEDPKIFKKKHIHTKSIGRWKHDLSNHEQKIVKKYCGQIIEKLGYYEFSD